MVTDAKNHLVGRGRVSTRSSATSCVRRVVHSASRSPSHPSCSLRSAGRLSPLPGSPVWWSGQGSRPGLASKHIRTCFGTPAATRWPTGGTTRGRCRPISGTKTSSTRCATPSYRRCGSRIFGGLERLTRRTSLQTDSSDRSRSPALSLGRPIAE